LNCRDYSSCGLIYDVLSFYFVSRKTCRVETSMSRKCCFSALCGRRSKAFLHPGQPASRWLGLVVHYPAEVVAKINSVTVTVTVARILMSRANRRSLSRPGARYVQFRNNDSDKSEVQRHDHGHGHGHGLFILATYHDVSPYPRTLPQTSP
jgi:hypothetical protein